MKRSELKQLIREIVQKILIKEFYETTIKNPSTGEDVDVIIDYNYLRGNAGRRIGMARFAEPDEPSQVEIQSIKTIDGQDIDPGELDRDTQLKLEAEIENYES